jgi:hypothetical protein
MDHELRITLQPERIPAFFPFLQRGVEIRGRVGVSVRAFLCEQVGLSAEYVDKRVQTVFLDGKAVDDVASATIKEGSILTLSAALPGLLGATLRSGSYYASLRSQISYREEGGITPSQEGTVILKLFNLLTRELGPGLFMQGVWIEGNALEDFFSNRSHRFRAGWVEVFADGERIDPEKLPEIEWGEGRVLLRLQEV